MVDRCVCHDVTFAELLRLVDERGLSLEELQEETGCGTGCGTCLPYIDIVLETRQTILPVLPMYPGP